MDEKLKAKWVKALRSGKYKQGKGLLRSSDDKFCCLGVLVDVMNPKAWAGEPSEIHTIISGKDARMQGYLAEDSGNGLTYETMAELRIEGQDQRDLVDMNDSGKRFSTIAKWIEKNL